MLYALPINSSATLPRVFKRKKGTLGLLMTGFPLNRYATFHFTDFGITETKVLRDIVVEFNERVSLTDVSLAVTFRSDAGSSTTTKVFGSGTVKSYRAAFSAASSQFNSIQIEFRATSTAAAGLIVDAIKVRFVIQPHEFVVGGEA